MSHLHLGRTLPYAPSSARPSSTSTISCRRRGVPPSGICRLSRRDGSAIHEGYQDAEFHQGVVKSYSPLLRIGSLLNNEADKATAVFRAECPGKKDNADVHTCGPMRTFLVES